MRTLVIGFCVAFALSLVTPVQAETRLEPGSPQWHALWDKCRGAVLRKYGEPIPGSKPGSRKVAMPNTEFIRSTEACVASRGRRF
jgi:hypothetical protein